MAAQYTQCRIVDMLRSEYGIAVQQGHISRIGSGEAQNPRYDLGAALVSLALKATPEPAGSRQRRRRTGNGQ